MKAIAAEGLTKVYGKLVAVDHVSFDVDEAEIFGFLGPNGAGKTTTIKMLNTLTRVSAGRALVNGFDVSAHGTEVRRTIGLVPQDLTLDREMTGRQNLTIQTKLYRVKGDVAKKRIKDLLGFVELEKVADREVSTYSWGMQKRLELAMGLVNTPKLLFLDEPTLGVDARSRSRIWEYVRKLRSESRTTIFLTTHYLEEADQLCERIAIIDGGKVKAIGPPADLKKSLGGETITFTLSTAFDEARLKSVISELSGVLSVRAEGGQCLVETTDSEKTLPSLVIAMSKAGAGIESVSVSKANLDQVFLKHISSGPEPEDEQDRLKMIARDRLFREE